MQSHPWLPRQTATDRYCAACRVLCLSADDLARHRCRLGGLVVSFVRFRRDTHHADGPPVAPPIDKPQPVVPKIVVRPYVPPPLALVPAQAAPVPDQNQTVQPSTGEACPANETDPPRAVRPSLPIPPEPSSATVVARPSYATIVLRRPTQVRPPSCPRPIVQAPKVVARRQTALVHMPLSGLLPFVLQGPLLRAVRRLVSVRPRAGAPPVRRHRQGAGPDFVCRQGEAHLRRACVSC